MILRLLFLLCFIFSFLGDFIIPISFGIPVFFVIASIFLLMIKPKYTINELCQLYKSPFRFMFYLFLWIIVGILLSIFTGKFNLSGFIASFIGGLFFTILAPILISNIAFEKIISCKRLIKFVFSAFFIIFLLGIVQFIGFYFNNPIIETFFYIIKNKIYLLAELDTVTKPFASGIPRVSGIFGEPSFLGFFIIVTSPIVYFLSKSKEKIYNNIYTDTFIKKSTYILMLINLLLTQSPIYILFGLVLLAILIVKKHIRPNLKSLLTVLVASIILLLSLAVSDLGNKMSNVATNVAFVGRIALTTESYKDFNKFVLLEPSLATRILAYISNITLWGKDPITGIGYGNLKEAMPKAIASLPIPLTPELEYRISGTKQATGMGTAIFFRLLAETGLVGVFLFYKFLLTLLSAAKKSIDSYEGIQKDFITGLRYFVLMLIINTFYNSHPHWAFIWLFVGITLAMVIFARKNQKIEKE